MGNKKNCGGIANHTPSEQWLIYMKFVHFQTNSAPTRTDTRVWPTRWTRPFQNWRGTKTIGWCFCREQTTIGHYKLLRFSIVLYIFIINLLIFSWFSFENLVIFKTKIIRFDEAYLNQSSMNLKLHWKWNYLASASLPVFLHILFSIIHLFDESQ